MYDLLVAKRSFAIVSFCLFAAFMWPLVVKDLLSVSRFREAQRLPTLEGRLVDNYRTNFYPRMVLVIQPLDQDFTVTAVLDHGGGDLLRENTHGLRFCCHS